MVKSMEWARLFCHLSSLTFFGLSSQEWEQEKGRAHAFGIEAQTSPEICDPKSQRLWVLSPSSSTPDIHHQFFWCLFTVLASPTAPHPINFLTVRDTVMLLWLRKWSKILNQSSLGFLRSTNSKAKSGCAIRDFRVFRHINGAFI